MIYLEIGIFCCIKQNVSIKKSRLVCLLKWDLMDCSLVDWTTPTKVKEKLKKQWKWFGKPVNPFTNLHGFSLEHCLMDMVRQKDFVLMMNAKMNLSWMILELVSHGKI